MRSFLHAKCGGANWSVESVGPFVESEIARAKSALTEESKPKNEFQSDRLCAPRAVQEKRFAGARGAVACANLYVEVAAPSHIKLRQIFLVLLRVH